MEEYQSLIGMLSMSMGVAWASGVNLYAALLVLGIGGATGNIALPEELQIVQDPMVMVAAGLMYLTEFVTDKIPGFDSTWDALHTFVRVPAGAMLAAGAVGDVTPVLGLTAGILGGGVAATSHVTKAGTRLAVNTSPEPFSNWGLSITEDIAVFAGLWAALTHPVFFLGLLILFICLAVWLLPKLWRFIKMIGTKLGQLFGFIDKQQPVTAAEGPPLEASSALTMASLSPPVNDSNDRPAESEKDSTIDQITKLKLLLDQGAISQTEFEKLKSQILN